MFSFFNRSRRHVAVLAALAMLASVLVAAPAVAADDPKPDLEATFTACVDIPASSFEDVPENHGNAGDIECIAYYGITQGTSTTTYSLLMSVTREHMALFLARLAARVGIELTSTPDDPGFTDTGDLSEKAQLAIAQLADADIAKGTSDTTFSPGDSVRRDHMALFLARLMDKMNPYGGADSGDAHTPSDVSDTDEVKSDDVGSPYTDLGSVTKSAYDAITALYELGVVSGISDTAYAPSALITRAAMAEFMVGVMDHSNLRPAGLSIQASDPSSFGENMGSVVVSVRDDSFAAVVDQVVDIFSSEVGAFDEDGACKMATASCEWNDGEGEELTGESGNIVDDGGATRGETNVFYAWIGSEDEEEFDVDETDHVSVSVESKKDEQALKVTTSISDNADGFTADLDKGGSVTVTVQLVDKNVGGDDAEVAGNAADDAKDVARAGIEITVGVTRQSNADSGDSPAEGVDVVFSSTDVATLTTDDDGKATYVVDAPDDDDDDGEVQVGDTKADDSIAGADDVAGLENRDDTLTFTYKQGADKLTVANAVIKIQWKEDDSVTTSASSSAPAYVVLDKDGDVAITASVTLYDQYGNGIREGGTGQKVAIAIGGTALATDGTDNVSVNRNGTATRRKVTEKDADNSNDLGTPFTIRYNELPQIDDNNPATTEFTGVEQTGIMAIDPDNGAKMAKEQMVQVVSVADDDDVGSVVVNSIDTDDAEFLANTADDVNTGSSDRVYSYDSDDTFVNSVPNGESEGELLTMDEFEDMLDDFGTVGVRAVVDVVVYNTDGSSIFKVTTKSSPSLA